MRRVLNAMTVGAVIFGITLSMLHQSGLGALFLMAKPKIHPLWYSEFIPILFFVSSIFAGLSMIIVEGTISHRVFGKLMDAEHRDGADEIVIGLARGAAIAMFVYYFFKTTLFIHDEQWQMMGDFWGNWFLLEVIGLVLVPCFMFAYGARHRNLSIIRTAAILTILGVVLNRLNISIIAFNWFVPDHYYPSWQEIVITLMIVFAEIWALRWVVLRMPVLTKAPGFG
jgi:Ni/Fe-hydrogenase subunit HybB-like protein